MPDISQQMGLVDSTPQEAAVNINNSRVFNIMPDAFKSMKDDLQPEVDYLKRPTETTPAVASYLSQSSEHAALVQNDVPKLTDMEKILKYAGDQVNGVREKSSQVNELALKKMWNPESFTQADDDKLFQLNEEMKSFSDYGASDDQKLIGNIAGGFASMGESIGKHSKLIAAGTGAGAFLGAGGGALAGGVGAIPGAIGGAITGFGNAATAAFIIDATNSQMGSVYNELDSVTLPNGQPLDHDTKKYTAAAVGLTTGIITTIVGKTVAKTIPFLNNIISPKMAAQIVSDPTKAALTKSLFDFGKSAFTGGSGAGTQRALEIFGTEFAKNYDGTEGSLINSLSSAAEQLKQRSGEIKTATIVGSAVTGGVTLAAGIAGFSQTKSRYKKAIDAVDESRFQNAKDVGQGSAPQLPPPMEPTQAATDILPEKPKGGGSAPATPQDKAVQVLRYDEALDHVLKIAKSTEMKNIAPEEQGKIIQTMFDQAGIKKVWVDKEDLTLWATDEKRAASVRDIIDPSGIASASRNTPIAVEPHKWLDIIEQYPDAADVYKLSPEGPTVAQAKKFLEDHAAAQEQRQQVLQKYNANPNPTSEDTAMVQNALNPEQPNRVYPTDDVFGEQGYLDQAQLKEALQKFMPEKQMNDYLEADHRARTSVVDGINQSSEYEMDQVRDVVMEMAKETEFQAQMQRLENNPNFALLDRFNHPEFRNVTRYLSLEEMTGSHAEKGFSPFAIDPRSLSTEESKQYLKNKQLKNHKVFVQGGISGEDAARLLGVNGADNLLKILSTTPTREEVAQGRVKAREADLKQQVRDSVPLNKTALAEAYANRLKNAVQTLHYMKDHEWSAMAGGIKKIALRPPTTQELLVEARKNIMSMKVGDLSANQFKVGERKSHRLAVESILKNQPEKAFMNQKAVAENIALAKEAHIKIGQVNRVIRFARQFKSPEIVQELKDAGKVYINAANEILDVFNLDPDKKGTSEKGSFKKYVEESLSGGGSAIQIPERLSDVRQNVNDMAVEQLLAVGDALKNMIHNAKWKNQLFKKHENIKAAQTLENFGRLITAQVSQLPDYDMKRNDVVQKSAVGRWEKLGQRLVDLTRTLEKSQHQLVRLDDGKVTGLMNDLVWRPITDANNAEKTLGLEAFGQLEKILDIFGKEEFEMMVGEYVQVPEFKDSPGLKGGRITKLDLFTMMLNMGNSGNVGELEKFGVSREVITTVLEREFDHRHMELAQRHWDIYKSFEQKITDLERRTEGVEADLVQAEPYTFNGKVYPGGYYPIFTSKDSVKLAAQKMEGAAKLNQTENLRQNLSAKAQTEQGHLEARVGNTSILDLDYGRMGHSLAQLIHDITHREAIRDVSKILSDKVIREQVVAGIGKSGYIDLTDMVIAVATSKDSYSRANDMVKQMMDHLTGGIQTVMIAGKATSVVMQVGSIPFAIDKMGYVSGTKHMTLTVSKLMQHPELWDKFFEFAAEIHPSIRDTAEGLEGDIYHKFKELVPEKGVPVLSLMNAGIQAVKESSFHLLGAVDMLNKIIVVLSGYSQAINGDASGVEAGDHAQAAKYASNLAELTQTHANERNLSPVQRERLMKPMLLFFNDANNAFNSSLFRLRELKNRLKVANRNLGQGSGGGGRGSGPTSDVLPDTELPDSEELKAAAKAIGSGVTGIMTYFMFTVALVGLFENLVHGDWSMFDDEKNKSLSQSAKDKLGNFAAGGGNLFINQIPVVRGIWYASGKYWQKRKQVEEPFTKMASDFATSVAGLKHLLASKVFDSGDGVSDQEKKAFVYSAGYLFHLPVDSIYKSSKWVKEVNNVFARSELADLTKEITSFVKKHEGDKQVSQGFIDQLKDLKQQIEPPKPQSNVPDKTYAIIKQIESKGNVFAYNPNSSAAGIYQFTESTWNDLRKRAPELGLTESGRISGNPDQQERAMKWLVEDNTKRLKSAGVEVSVENIYAAHFLGVDKAVQVLKAKGDTKLKSLVGDDVMSANNFRNTMKVKEFKDWLIQKSIEAETQIGELQAKI